MILLALLGCYPEERFVADFDAAVCDWKARCYDDNENKCLADAAAARTEHTCDYSSDDAQVCTDGLEELACPDDTGAEEAFGFPEACDAVWECDG